MEVKHVMFNDKLTRQWTSAKESVCKKNNNKTILYCVVHMDLLNQKFGQKISLIHLSKWQSSLDEIREDSAL